MRILFLFCLLFLLSPTVLAKELKAHDGSTITIPNDFQHMSTDPGPGYYVGKWKKGDNYDWKIIFRANPLENKKAKIFARDQKKGLKKYQKAKIRKLEVPGAVVAYKAQLKNKTSTILAVACTETTVYKIEFETKGGGKPPAWFVAVADKVIASLKIKG